RFGRHIEISPPDEKAREIIFNIHLKNKPLAKDLSIQDMVKRLDGYTGADISAICEEATLLTIRKAIADISIDTHDKDSVSKVRIGSEEFNKAIDKAIKSADRAQKAYKDASKEPREDLYR
ncbi:MAG: AAA family ATPase, partial [Candidatus Lokiarchaeota archaeon]|nr:AAA family ATPase [Candidatus Lokiarchaeota archaeon]